MSGLLQGKKALITGGTAGIGQAIAILYAAHGADVAILGTNEIRSQETIQKLNEHRLDRISHTHASKGGHSVTSDLPQECEKCGLDSNQQFSYFLVDVANTSAMEKTIATLLSSWGTIDILVNNAGITRDNLLMRMSEEDWDRVMEVNLKSVYNSCKVLSRPMMKAKSGVIINISSVVGLTGNAGQTNYAASKSGMIGFTKALAKELASRNIRVNCIAPGYIDTQMTEALSSKVKEEVLSKIPLNRMGKPLDIANAALYLASDLASYVTGQVIAVDGGMVM
jgi:3-oxoacyl-[acyl-carrier protein] reductase